MNRKKDTVYLALSPPVIDPDFHDCEDYVCVCYARQDQNVGEREHMQLCQFHDGFAKSSHVQINAEFCDERKPSTTTTPFPRKRQKRLGIESLIGARSCLALWCLVIRRISREKTTKSLEVPVTRNHKKLPHFIPASISFNNHCACKSSPVRDTNHTIALLFRVTFLVSSSAVVVIGAGRGGNNYTNCSAWQYFFYTCHFVRSATYRTQ